MINFKLGIIFSECSYICRILLSLGNTIVYWAGNYYVEWFFSHTKPEILRLSYLWSIWKGNDYALMHLHWILSFLKYFQYFRLMLQKYWENHENKSILREDSPTSQHSCHNRRAIDALAYLPNYSLFIPSRRSVDTTKKADRNDAWALKIHSVNVDYFG